MPISYWGDPPGYPFVLSRVRVLCLCVHHPSAAGRNFGYLRRGQRAVLRPNNTRSGGIRRDSGWMAAASLALVR